MNKRLFSHPIRSSSSLEKRRTRWMNGENPRRDCYWPENQVYVTPGLEHLCILWTSTLQVSWFIIRFEWISFCCFLYIKLQYLIYSNNFMSYHDQFHSEIKSFEMSYSTPTLSYWPEADLLRLPHSHHLFTHHCLFRDLYQFVSLEGYKKNSRQK